MPNNVIVPDEGSKCVYPIFDSENQKKYCLRNKGQVITSTDQKILKSEENTYFLEHSTDTTAARSFDNATFLSVVFVLCATWFAWWCAKRSFNLTTNSFNITLKQIEASISASEKQTEITLEQIKDSSLASEKQTQLTLEQINASAEASERQTQLTLEQIKASAEASERQTNATIESHISMIKSQESVNLQTIKANSRQNWINTVRDHAIDFIFHIDKYTEHLKLTHNRYYMTDTDQNTDFPIEMEVLRKHAEYIHKRVIQFSLFLNPNDQKDIDVLESAKEVDTFVKSILDKFESTPNIKDYINEIQSSKNVFESTLQMILKTEWEKIKKGE